MPWPSGLPELNIVNGYAERILPGYYESANSGPKKRRPNPVKPNAPINFTQRLTSDELDTLETYYESLSDGTLSDSIFHPRTGETITFQFVGEIHKQHIGGRLYDVSFQIEVLP